ncbi:hypothetical protein AGIG_G21970 [Arapaima gigas]
MFSLLTQQSGSHQSRNTDSQNRLTGTPAVKGLSLKVLSASAHAEKPHQKDTGNKQTVWCVRSWIYNQKVADLNLKRFSFCKVGKYLKI